MEHSRIQHGPYDHQVDRYDRWFERNRASYLSELRAVESLMPRFLRGLEVGVGTGRFAAPLGVSIGIDPSGPMIEVARERGVLAVRGVAERLPFGDEKFDLVLMVTVVFLLRDRAAAFLEATRVLKPGGSLIVGFIDKESRLGQRYEGKKEGGEEMEKKDKRGFYADANFLVPEEMAALLEEAGFRNLAFVQTLFCEPENLRSVETPTPGYGRGSFIVVRGVKEAGGN
ncbi:MAG TPA: class I SAM-dependent methyltransferase [Methanothrix sp.]|nr:class I SAM-dependent methyltransferase [Methanothrix sp.]HPJ84254.1 class I SAM-dependent methyltransferase [Methanothrix sp.]HPR66372.1 class I SAM-dependent methyltransferase [Methanothrix sp.]